MSDFAHVRFTAGGVPHDIAVVGSAAARTSTVSRATSRGSASGNATSSAA